MLKKSFTFPTKSKRGISRTEMGLVISYSYFMAAFSNEAGPSMGLDAKSLPGNRMDQK